MSSSKGHEADSTYPLRTASRLTGLSPDLRRAWERRYGVIEPMRTPGGTRRYSAADIERLRLVKAAVDAGLSTGINVIAYARRDLGPDNIHAMLDILDHPLETRTSALETPSPPK